MKAGWAGSMGSILMAASLLAACAPSADLTPVDQSIPSWAAETLTAAPTLPPTATAPPSATIPPTAAPTDTPSPSPTLSPTPGPSPTSTAPPLAPDDPRQGLNLAAPDERDDFSQHFGWYEFDDPNATTIVWSPGKLTITDPRVDAYTWWSTSSASGRDVYVEIAAQTSACAGLDAYGLAARIGGEQYDRGYTLELSCDGHFRMRKFVSGRAPLILIDWTASPSIITGPGAENRLGFLLKGSDLIGFANGHVLGRAKDSDFVFGNFGLFALAAETPGLSVEFTDFALWQFPP
jgi:hypothetical protein